VGAARGVSEGWIYALTSEAVPLCKIGLTTTSPAQRIREINQSANYGPHGPWKELDVRRVRDVANVEKALHLRLAEQKSNDIPKTRELFRLSREEARAALDSIPAAELTEAVPIHELRIAPDFLDYLMALFQQSGLENFRSLQESWTFSLFPSTAGGRFFTLNIDQHEVAFSQPSPNGGDLVLHRVVVDEMVRRDRTFRRMLRQFGGRISRVGYRSNWGAAVAVDFEVPFGSALSLFEHTAFRRALIAYWYDALLRMQSSQSRSLFARFHNYDAVSEIFRHMEERRRFRST